MNNEITRYQICTQKKKRERETLTQRKACYQHGMERAFPSSFAVEIRTKRDTKKKKRESTFRMMILRYGKHINLTRECVARRQKKKREKKKRETNKGTNEVAHHHHHNKERKKNSRIAHHNTTEKKKKALHYKKKVQRCVTGPLASSKRSPLQMAPQSWRDCRSGRPW